MAQCPTRGETGHLAGVGAMGLSLGASHFGEMALIH